MRRLLAAILLAAALPVVPVAAEPTAATPAPAIAPDTIGRDFKPGRRVLAPAPEAERLHRQYEALAFTKESAELARSYAEPLARAAEGYDSRLANAVAMGDLDGDGVEDLLLYDMTLWRRPANYDGDTTLAVFSGRTGRQLWRRTFEDVALPMIYEKQVGNRRNGLVLIDFVGTSEADYGYRFIGIGGNRGDVVYDTTVANGQGRNDQVQVGGFFDAFSGGGTDILVARVEGIVTFGVAVDGVMPPSIDFWQAYVVDGRDGKVRAVSERELGIGGYPAFSTIGDVDGDSREDYAIFRRGVTETGGTVDTRSVVEMAKLWENTAVPLGWFVWLPTQADLIGDRRTDLFYGTDLGDANVSLSPLTDEMVLFQAAVAGSHGVLLDGADGVLRRDLADGLATGWDTYPDVDRDGKRDLIAVTTEQGLREYVMTFALLTKAGTVTRWRREVRVPFDVPGASEGSGFAYLAGDLDADGLQDVAYEIVVGRVASSLRWTTGFVLGRTGQVLQTRDRPLFATLDGRGDDRYGSTAGKDRERRPRTTFAMRDGRRGTTYWSVAVTEPDSAVWVTALRGQRGRCAGVAVISFGLTQERWGEVWVAVLDGTTGRVRWSRPLNLRPRALDLSAPSGPATPCR